jgi:hypothetical protein
MPVRFSQKEKVIEAPELFEPITSNDFEKKLESWEVITLRLLQNISKVLKRIDDFQILIKEGTINGAEMRAYFVNNLQMPLEDYQKTIYASYKVFLQTIKRQLARFPETSEMAAETEDEFKSLKHFDINAQIIISVCANIFKQSSNIEEQLNGLRQVFKTRLSEMQKQVTRQHENMHELLEKLRVAKAKLGQELVGV